jgi:phosphomannomutase
VAVSDPVPGALTILANDIGGRIYRPNQPGYRELCQLQPFFHDGVFAAARIAAGMAARGETLAELSEMIPKFSTFSREVTVYGDRGRVMRRLTEKFPGSATEKGLCINLGSGGIFIRPDPCRPVLRLRAECETTEAARELCDDARREIRNFDLTD